jgi:hypothetical protein
MQVTLHFSRNNAMSFSIPKDTEVQHEREIIEVIRKIFKSYFFKNEDVDILVIRRYNQ